LAALSLAILHIHIAASVLQTTILEKAIHKHPVIQDDMLIFECSVLVASHGKTRPKMELLKSMLAAVA
jgi:hypothetical protein